MRHRKAGRKLKRTASHRAALLNSLSTSLLRHKKIHTTLAKAKETQKKVEAIITRAKRALAVEGDGAAQRTVHAKREVARVVKDRAVVKSLFEEIAPKVASRPGGYTRLIKLGQRQGDGAQIAALELIDFNLADAAGSSKAKKSRKTTKKAQPAPAAAKPAVEPVAETPAPVEKPASEGSGAH